MWEYCRWILLASLVSLYSVFKFLLNLEHRYAEALPCRQLWTFDTTCIFYGLVGRSKLVYCHCVTIWPLTLVSLTQSFGHRSVPAVPFPFRWEGLHSGRATNSYKIEQISTTDGRKEKQWIRGLSDILGPRTLLRKLIFIEKDETTPTERASVTRCHFLHLPRR